MLCLAGPVSVPPRLNAQSPSAGDAKTGKQPTPDVKKTTGTPVNKKPEFKPEVLNIDPNGVKLSGTYLNRIRLRGKLIIGLQKNYQPLHIENPNPNFPGIDVEIGAQLARGLGVPTVEYRYLTLPELLRAVSSGEIDLSLGGISSTLHRARFVNFTPPYIRTTAAGLLNKGVLPPDSGSVDFPRRKFESLRDLRHLGKLTLGVKGGTTNEKILRSSPEFAKHTIVLFKSRKAQIEALKKGEIDVLVADGLFIRSLVLRDASLLANFVPLVRRYREEHICIALPRGDPEYWNYLNFFIRDLRRSGKLDRLVKKYFDGDGWIKKAK